MIKYIIVPGPISSINDSQVHYISAKELMRLYRVPPNECIVVDEYVNTPWRLKQVLPEGIWLTPQVRFEDYKLP